MNYRREIDGLRAIAVLSVILFHAGFPGIKGGFVGVDVFFVISGYLITTIILSECENNTFTLVGFYERRVRRILPALFFVLLCCLPAAYVLLFPDQMTQFAKSLLSGLFFVSNYFFRSNLDYFAPNAEEEPLLHLWSLAVEEQYYIFFPLLAVLLWRRKEWNFKVAKLVWRHQSWGFIALVLLVSVASFIYAERKHGAETLFYDTRGRVWELFIGSLSAIYLRGRERMPRRVLAECGSALGLLLILAACFGINKEMPFPGHWALLPTLGTALIVIFASPGTLAGRLLSTRILVGVGLISYSAYLWHWPLFVFARIAIQEPSLWLFSGLSIVSLCLAFVSWRYVERPFRDRQLLQRAKIFRFASLGVILLVVAGCVGLNGLSSRFNAEDADLLVSNQERGKYVEARYNQLVGVDHFSSEKTLHVLLLGDSYSQDLMNIMAEAELLSDAEISVRYIRTRCQIYLGEENGLNFVAENDRAQCAKSVYKEGFYASLDPLIQDANIIIFASSWREWAAHRLVETIKNFHIPDLTKIIVIGKKDFGKIRRRDYLGFSFQEKVILRNNIDADTLDINKILRAGMETMNNVEFIDLQEMICGTDSQSCPVFSPSGELLSHDGRHLTQAGAVYIGGLLKEHPVFKPFENKPSNMRLPEASQ